MAHCYGEWQIMLQQKILMFCRVMVKGREVKVNIFDMAGHPVFYEVDYLCSTSNYQLKFIWLSMF